MLLLHFVLSLSLLILFLFVLFCFCFRFVYTPISALNYKSLNYFNMYLDWIRLLQLPARRPLSPIIAPELSERVCRFSLSFFLLLNF